MLALWLALLRRDVRRRGDAQRPDRRPFSIPGTESQQAIDLLQERLPEANGASGRIVFAAPEGETLTGARRAAVEAALAAAVAKAPGVQSASDPFDGDLVSEDGRIALSQVSFDTRGGRGLEDGPREAVQHAAARDRAHAGVQVEFGGDAVIEAGRVGGIGEVLGVARRRARAADHLRHRWSPPACRC